MPPPLPDYRLLVTYPWRFPGRARREVVRMLRMLGDERPAAERTICGGVLGVRTRLDPRAVVRDLRARLSADPDALRSTCRWLPVDAWAPADLEAMKAVVLQLRDRIRPGETWRLTVDRHASPRHHREDLVEALAELVPAPVDLDHPDRILRVDLLGEHAALSVVQPSDVLGVPRRGSSGERPAGRLHERPGMNPYLRTRQHEIFVDRIAAGRALAERLLPMVEGPCVVAAIPRGGVTVALPVAERLGAPVRVVYARKLTAPVAPELAFGALDEDGECILDDRIVRALDLAPADVEQARSRVGAEIRRRMALYRVPALAEALADRTVVLIDDGLATGLTMRAAVAYARRHAAPRIVVAVPCASVQAAGYFEKAADRFLALVIDPEFMAVGAYYRDFSPVTDDAVLAMLDQAGARGPAGAGSVR
jgi:putative phosphoribosyl transferase